MLSAFFKKSSSTIPPQQLYGSVMAQARLPEFFIDFSMPDTVMGDVERALRELGIGDTSVPKKKKKMIRSFYGQIDDFDEPINAGDKEAISEKVQLRYLSETQNADPYKLTSYILKTESHLKGQSMKALLSGEVNWVSPESFVA